MAQENETAGTDDNTLIELTAGIVQSYVNNNQTQPDQVPHLMQQVHDKFVELRHGPGHVAAPSEANELTPQHEPPVKPRNSIRKNDVVCLECGKTYKLLKRHIRTEHGMDEDTYKERWGLSPSTKLVAKTYSEQRSNMAKEIGLGSQGRKRS